MLWPPDSKSWLVVKDPDAGRDWRQEKKGTTEDEMVEWRHQFNGHESEQAPWDGEGREAWRAEVHGVAKSQTRLSDWTRTASSGLLTVSQQSQSTGTRLWRRNIQCLLQGTKQGELAAHAQKTQTLHWLLDKGFLRQCWGNCHKISLRTFFWLVDGEVTGWCFWDLNHQPSSFNSLGLCACDQRVVIILYLSRGGRVIVSAEQIKYKHQIITYIPLGGYRSPVTLVLIISYLSLFFEIWRRPKRQKPFFLQIRNRGHGRPIVPRNAPQGPTWFQSPLFFDNPQSWGQLRWDEKGNKGLNRKMNHKLSRGTVLGGLGCSYS